MTVRELMSEKPVTISPACTAEQALDTLYEYETPELYVVEKSGRFLGILPDYEILKAQLSGEADHATVEQLMSRMVPTVSPDADAAEIAKSFRVSHCSRIPVVKAGKLVGMVTRADVIRMMAVLKRIAPEKRVGPRRPKLLSSAKSPANRMARAKSMESKTSTKSNPRSRRSMALSAR